MYVKIAYMETTKKANGLKLYFIQQESIKMVKKIKGIGISFAKRSKNTTLGININDVLKTNKGVDVNG